MHNSTGAFAGMKRDEGFTLVEIAIVLVIIGLLIGGILAAKSMISTAKINAQVRQIGQFDAMVMNFKDKFNYLPGDAPPFGNEFYGDGDGRIEDQFDANNFFSEEVAFFWNQLSSTAPMPQTYSASVTDKVIVDANIPRAKLGEGVGVVGSTGLNAAGPFYLQNYYFLGLLIQSFGDSRMCNQPGIAATDAQAIDIKFDDGSANTGNVIALGAVVCCDDHLTTSASSTASSGCVVNGDISKYNNSSTSEYPCNLGIRMGTSTGSPP